MSKYIFPVCTARDIFNLNARSVEGQCVIDGELTFVRLDATLHVS